MGDYNVHIVAYGGTIDKIEEVAQLNSIALSNKLLNVRTKAQQINQNRVKTLYFEYSEILIKPYNVMKSCH